jgi:hypothetical protein
MKNFFNKLNFDLWEMFANTKPYFLRRFPGDDGSAPLDPNDKLGLFLNKCMSLAVGAVVTAFCFGVSIVCFCIIYGYFFPVK